MKASLINKKYDFISGWYIDKKVCKNVIKFFNRNKKNHVQGKVGNNEINKKVKVSTDLSVMPNYEDDKDWSNYLTELRKVLDNYKKEYPFSNVGHSPWGCTEGINIQRYKPNEGFYEWHSERTGITKPLRHLVFMTYLNDVKNKGETEFYHQKLKVKPETGLTLIWPSDWTFLHRGIPSKTETKYIVTGWYSYLSK